MKEKKHKAKCPECKAPSVQFNYGLPEDKLASGLASLSSGGTEVEILLLAECTNCGETVQVPFVLIPKN